MTNRSAREAVTEPNAAVQPDPRIARAAAGDRQAAHALLSELLPRVRNLVRYLVRGDAWVDDITQQVLIELLRSFRSFRNDGSLHGWVHRITVRVALRQAQKARREQRQAQEMGAELYAIGHEGSDEYLRRRTALALLDALPDEQRQVLVLHHVAGLSVPELADALSIPFETARSRLRLGMSKLRERMNAAEEDHD